MIHHPQFVPQPIFIPIQPRGHRTMWGSAVGVAVLAVLIGAGFFAVDHVGSGDSSAQALSGTGIAQPAAAKSSAGLAPAHVSTSKGVVYHWRSGHFTARFPAAPTTRTDTGSAGPVNFVLHLASDVLSHTAVGVMDFKNVPAAEHDQVLQGFLAKFRTSASQPATATVFDNHRAWQITLVATDGTPLTVIAVAYPTDRFYVLTAATGTSFAALAHSFAALP